MAKRHCAGFLAWAAVLSVGACDGDGISASTGAATGVTAFDSRAILAIRPNAVAFGALPLGASSAPVAITVSNLGARASGPLGVVLDGTTSFAVTACTRSARILRGGASCTVSVRFSPTGAVGAKTARLTVRATPGGSVTASLAGTARLPSADLSIASLAAAPRPLFAGTAVTYTVRAHNAGPDAAPATFLTDTLPASATFVSATSSQGACSAAGATVTCSLGSVPSPGDVTVAIVALATAAGTITDGANVASGIGDPNAGNDAASLTTTVCNAGEADPAAPPGGGGDCPLFVAAWASGEDAGYAPRFTLDGDEGSESRWLASGSAWLRYDLSQNVVLDGARLRFYQGDSIAAAFSIDTSTDGLSWTRVFTGRSSGAATGFESFSFGQSVIASRIRVNGGASLVEAQFLGGGQVVVGAGTITQVECLSDLQCDDHDVDTADACRSHQCGYAPIPCGPADGMCPRSCSAAADPDCLAACPNGSVGSACSCAGSDVTAGFCCAGDGAPPIPSSLPAASRLVVEGTTVADTETGVGIVVNIPRNTPIAFEYRNNFVTARNGGGYLLAAGGESPSFRDHDLDGSVIVGNRLTWTGADPTAITHALFVGYGVNHQIEYNFLKDTPYGIVTKSSGMTFTSGGIAYNVITNSVQGACAKGINGVKFYNNTFYEARTSGVTALLRIYPNTDAGAPGFPSTNAQVLNNVFYTRTPVPMIMLSASSRPGFVSDYNVFYSESGSPQFVVEGLGNLGFAQWQALGYDAHSIVVDPRFLDTDSLIPSAPLRYGKDLGADWRLGLSPATVWGEEPITVPQGSTWQVGAYVLD